MKFVAVEGAFLPTGLRLNNFGSARRDREWIGVFTPSFLVRFYQLIY